MAGHYTVRQEIPSDTGRKTESETLAVIEEARCEATSHKPPGKTWNNRNGLI